VLRCLAFGLVVAAAVGGAADRAGAHPLGNFTVNRYAGITVAPGELRVHYVVDTAEIPTFQARDDIDRDGDRQLAPGELAAYATDACERITGGLDLAIDRRQVAVHPVGATAATRPGQAGLDTLRLECDLTAAAPKSGRVEFTDRNEPERVGWREIVAAGDGTTLHDATVPAQSLTAALREYPDDQLAAPLDVRTASFSYTPGGAAAPTADAGDAAGAAENPITDRYEGFTSWFTSSVEARRLTLGLALLATAAAIVLGAFHAIAPGHGKTVLAAYLVGERGSVREGMLLGLTVAVTHTLGVLVLGAVLTASQTFAPESVYPWLGVLSGVCFAALGVSILARAMRGRRGGHGHRHGGHVHDDHHHGHDHGHGHGSDHPHDHRDGRPPMRPRELITLGFAGGLVPTPSALVVLLGATAIGRAWFGVLLVIAYGAGMSATLVAAGLALAWARRRFELRAASERALRIAAVLPIVTGLVVTLGGLTLIARSV
jgi:ABC-type nickel/cobalt efflux system permease component RcnA